MLGVVEVISSLPELKTLNFANNRLTDISIKPLVTSIFTHLKCISLNFSNNKIDADTIAMLLVYLKSPSCILKVLIYYYIEYSVCTFSTYGA